MTRCLSEKILSIPHVEHSFFTKTSEDQIPSNIIKLTQTHSAEVLTITDEMPEELVADAVVTNQPNLWLSVYTADCAPVLLACRSTPIIAAVHAGWRGALNGIVQNAVAEMKKLGAEDIVAAIGPCISQESYEVSSAFIEMFIQISKENERFFKPGREGHAYFDLSGYVTQCLEHAGVKEIEKLPYDTCQEEELFYSHRRGMLNGYLEEKRQISAIKIKVE